MSRILIIEDEETIAELEKDYLELSGFEVIICNRGDLGLEKALKEEFDLIILDLMLPEVDGFDICRQVREEKNTPIIMVSAKKDDIDKIRGLGLGADDYMTKPFSVMEMVARIKAILRRSNEGSDAKGEVKFGKIVINEVKHSVTADDKKLDLSLKEFELLLLLIKHPGRVYSRDELLNLIWGIDYDGENRTVDVHIRALRSKLGDLENVIQTVRGIGYKADA